MANRRNTSINPNKLKDLILSRGTNIDDVVKLAKQRMESFDNTIKLRIVKASEDMNEIITRLKLDNPDKSPNELQDMGSYYRSFY